MRGLFILNYILVKGVNIIVKKMDVVNIKTATMYKGDSGYGVRQPWL